MDLTTCLISTPALAQTSQLPGEGQPACPVRGPAATGGRQPPGRTARGQRRDHPRAACVPGSPRPLSWEYSSRPSLDSFHAECRPPAWAHRGAAATSSLPPLSCVQDTGSGTIRMTGALGSITSLQGKSQVRAQTQLHLPRDAQAGSTWDRK